MNSQTQIKPLGLRPALGFAVLAVVSFHLAYEIKNCQFLLVAFFISIFHLVNLRTSRQAFYAGLTIGIAIYAPQLAFFWTIFNFAAISLWTILSCWLGLFFLLGRAILRRFGTIGWAYAAPFVWIGLEYFRSELYYLRFSWMNAGYAFSDSAILPYAASYGVYGVGFLFMTVAAFLGVVRHLRWRGRALGAIAIALLLLYPVSMRVKRPPGRRDFRVTGVQLEIPSTAEVLPALDQAIHKFPQTDLLVLSEYTFMGPIPEAVQNWCQAHRKYLVVGGETFAPNSQYYNTAFVVGPDGKIVFQQDKCVPVQFMKDGLPATKQQLWDSPWGKLGFGICYDASYSRVVDELVRQGAQGLIFPTMDVAEWGEHQHQLHARVAPMRAAEYAVPIFRLCSSGISQYVEPNGHVVESAPYPGQRAIMSAEMQLTSRGRVPPDRSLAKLSVGLTGALGAWLIIDGLRQRRASLATIST